MKHKLLVLLIITGLLLNVGGALALEAHTASFPLSSTAILPGTVRIATTEPASIDPAKAVDFTITNQLFSGLTRIDPLTNAPIPDLASSWSMSPGATQFTFTLRSGITWSNGTPITADDVKYSILRSLNPTTGSDYAHILFAIQNAAEYHNGSISDPNLVGVTVLDSTQVRFTLVSPTSYFPAILAMPIAYPVPAASIATWGTAWTEANHILTSGPYRLTEWVHNDHMLLDKYTSFYGATNVQIPHISVKLLDEMAAWNLFLGGNLDTTTVPSSVLNAVRADPALNPLLHYANTPCTYYYGFSISQPPFNDPLVRKAFIAAVNRQGLIDTLLGGYQQPAQTFTSPGIFGHVDGSSEGVGIPYSPNQAKQWLSNAGYPNGVGLPPITLWYNTSTGHQSIAEYIRQNWITNLNVTITLQSMPWENYLDQINTGASQIWRLGWCYDYNDAYDFLYEAMAPFPAGKYGGWSNTTYLNLLNQAAQSADNTTRQLYYKQAEEILVETDAVMLPIYFYETPAITQPYLQRPYHSQDLHIRDWRLATFGDTPTSHWAWSFIERLYAAGITGGCASNPLQYCPESSVTRGQMAVFLERGIHGSSYTPPAVGPSTGFNDVPTNYWSAAWIKQLAADGITGGCGSGNYCPDDPVTRAQMAVFLLRAKYGSSYTPPTVGSISGFNDVATNYWAAAWIKQLAAEGITGGCGTGVYCPESPVTRAQMAVFLVRTFNLP